MAVEVIWFQIIILKISVWLVMWINFIKFWLSCIAVFRQINSNNNRIQQWTSLRFTKRMQYKVTITWKDVSKMAVGLEFLRVRTFH